jgi:hypothetical protein
MNSKRAKPRVHAKVAHNSNRRGSFPKPNESGNLLNVIHIFFIFF